MKYLAPRSLPPFSCLLHNLGNPPPDKIARYLGVSVRSVYRWRASDQAPRTVLMALFWESSYGLSTLDCELFNSFMVHKKLSEALDNQCRVLAQKVAQMEQIGSFGSANAPYLTPPATLPSLSNAA